MSSVFFYDRAQIADWLDSHTIAKARDYIRAVSKLRWQDNTLSGEVQGTARWPYEVDVHFYDTEDGPWIESECTCALAFDCKHVAALLIAGLEKMPKPKLQTGVRPEVVNWLETFRADLASSAPNARKAASKPTHTLAYVLGWSRYHQRHQVEIFKARRNADGTIRSIDDAWNNVEAALLKPPKFVTDDDLTILRGLWLGRCREDYGSFVLRGSTGADVLQKLTATGRLFTALTANHGSPPTRQALSEGAARPGHIEWQPQPDDCVRPVLRTEPLSTMLLETEPAWYVDAQMGEAGIVQLPLQSLQAQQLAAFLAMPPISLTEAPLVGAVLREIVPELPSPPAPNSSELRIIDTEPVPILSLDTRPLYMAGFGKYDHRAHVLDFAAAGFDYEGVTLNADSSATLVSHPDGNVVQIRRRPDAEKNRLLELRNAGLQKIPAGRVQGPQTFPGAMLGLQEPDAWYAFVNEALPSLRSKGWRVAMSTEFRFNVIEIDAIDGAARHAGDGWFDLVSRIGVMRPFRDRRNGATR